MVDPKVSVVVRSCGRPLLLQRALDSIEAQSLAPSEVIIVAIGQVGAAALSTIRCQLKLRTVHTTEGRVRGGALNDGIRLARGDWFAFLDDDDTWEPSFLKDMVAEANVRDRVGAIVCRTELVYERLQDGRPVVVGRKEFNSKLSSLTDRELAMGNRFTINAAIWRRSVFAGVGEFREDLAVLEDWEFNVRASTKFAIHVLPKVLAHYHQRPPSVGLIANSHFREHDKAAFELQSQWEAQGLLPASSCVAVTLRRWLRRVRRCGSRLRWGFR